MQRRTKKIAITCIAVCGLFLTVSPFFVSFAQKSKTEKSIGETRQDEQAREAKQVVAKSVAGSIFLDAVTTKESNWTLNKAGYLAKDANNNSASTSMLFTKGEHSVGISISEYNSAENAAKPFHTPRSYGANVKFDTYGDEGEKLIGPKGDFLAIRFRQGNFFVSIFTPDEKAAIRFADYATEAVKNFALK